MTLTLLCLGDTLGGDHGGGGGGVVGVVEWAGSPAIDGGPGDAGRVQLVPDDVQ